LNAFLAVALWVSCEMLCPYKLLLLLLWFLLQLFVALMQLFLAVSMLVVLVESAKMLQPAVLMLTSTRLPRTLLQVELLSVRS